MRRRILISACLLGVHCRYDGQAKAHPEIEQLKEQYELVPVCPEQLGGLPTPRAPAERRGNQVVTKVGGDVTESYRRGAEETLRLAQLLDCQEAVLKERSPSCGSGQIYDGSFQKKLVHGDGVTAELLTAHGISVFGESQLRELAALGDDRPDSQKKLYRVYKEEQD